MDDGVISSHEYLWITEADEHILVPAGKRTLTDGSESYLIVHLPTETCLIFEIDEENHYVVKRMLEAGVKVVEDYFASQK